MVHPLSSLTNPIVMKGRANKRRGSLVLYHPESVIDGDPLQIGTALYVTVGLGYLLENRNDPSRIMAKRAGYNLCLKKLLCQNSM